METKWISSTLEVGVNMLTKEQKDHYWNTTFLKEIKEEGQEKLLSSHVLVIGCGGLAASALLYLTSMGVGHITIVDNDIISVSNLPRQILFTYDDIGLSKVDTAKKRLEKMNPDVEIKTIKERINEINVESIIKGHDIVLECTDNFETKFLINDTCMSLNIPFVIAGVSDYQGQICTCIPNISKDFKSLFSTLPINIDDKYKEEDQGVFPLSVGIVSNIADSEVVKYLLNIDNLLLNKMLVVNLKNNDFKIIEFPK